MNPTRTRVEFIGRFFSFFTLLSFCRNPLEIELERHRKTVTDEDESPGEIAPADGMRR